MEFITIVLLILTLILCGIIYFRRQQSHWANVGIPYIKPEFPYGNLGSPYKQNKHLSSKLKDYYDELKGRGPFGGIYFFHKPTVLTLDLEFIKKVLIKDFNHFHDRGVYYNERDDPLSAHLFAIDGQKWKNLRNQLTPTFTSGKMKFMYPTICNVARNFEECIRKMIAINKTIEMKDISARFSTDVIGTCAFGIDCNSLKDPNAQFRVMGRKIFDNSSISILQRVFMITFKRFALFFKMKTTENDVEKFFLNIVRETVEFRETKNIKRNDFMDILIKLKNRIGIHDMDDEKLDVNGKNDTITPASPDGKEGLLTLNQISAQAFIFFLAGFETSSTTMTFCLYELAVNQDIQEKLRHEIRRVLAKHNNDLTYEAIMEMDYLEQVINESLRKYPPVGNLIREVTKDYYVPEYKYMMKKGMQVLIPVYGIQHDPEHYPNPEKFDPERFSKDEVKKRNDMTFLTFGDGPRNCIGMRFGYMQTRIGLVTLINKFEVTPSADLKVPLVLSNTSLTLSPEGGLPLNVKEI